MDPILLEKVPIFLQYLLFEPIDFDCLAEPENPFQNGINGLDVQKEVTNVLTNSSLMRVHFDLGFLLHHCPHKNEVRQFNRPKGTIQKFVKNFAVSEFFFQQKRRVHDRGHHNIDQIGFIMESFQQKIVQKLGDIDVAWFGRFRLQEVEIDPGEGFLDDLRYTVLLLIFEITIIQFFHF
jgi:hypothetical protein